MTSLDRVSAVAKPKICPRCDGPLFDLWGDEPESEGPHCLLVDESHFECRLCTCAPTDRDSCFAYPRPVPEANATPKQLADAKRDCTERRRAIGEVNLNATINPIQEMQWLDDAVLITRRVASGETILAPIFWLRLFGILHDMWEKEAKVAQFCSGLGVRVDPRIVAFLKEIEDLNALFTDDERLYIQYRRDVEAHPVQVNYEFRIDGKGKAKDKLTPKITDKKLPVTLDEFREAMRRVLATAKHETEIARAFAGRCVQTLERVREKGRQIYTA